MANALGGSIPSIPTSFKGITMSKFSESFENFAVSVKRELEYLERTVEEQREIIEQLTGTGKPKGYFYMHPFDVSDSFQKIDMACLELNKVAETIPEDGLIRINGRIIKQSSLIPPTTRNIF